MDHVLKALDEHIAHQDWLLKCEKKAKEDAEKERDRAITERDNVIQENAVLRAQLAATPATLSRAEVEERRAYETPAAHEDLGYVTQP